MRRLPAMTHRLVAALAEVPTEELGEPTLAAALSTLLRISKAEAHRRIHEAEDLGPRAAVTGEALEPVLAHTAAAQRRGDIGAEHVKIIRRFFDRLPDFVDFDTRETAEAQLAELAGGLKPEELRQVADRLAILLDQDGELSDADRARRRYLRIDRQQSDGMSEIRGRLDPEARASLEAVFAKWAAPGMCNPDDEKPCLDGDPSPEAVTGDYRSTGQRNHDALKAIGRADSGLRAIGQSQGATCHDRRVHHAQGVGIGQGTRGHRRRQPAAHVGGDPSGIRGSPLFGGVRRPHRMPAVSGAQPSTRLSRATHRVVRQRSRVYQARLHRTGLSQRGPPSTPAGPTGGQTDIDRQTLACGRDNRRVKTRRLEDPKTQRRPHRMDPTAPPRHRPSPRQQLSPS